MPNPFLQRASEYQRSEVEFLATLSPLLFRISLDAYKDPRELLTKTVVFTAPPGSGKTTLARFFQYTTLTRLKEQVVRTPDSGYQELLDFATERGFLVDGQIAVCGVRISMERDYRELAQLGYDIARSHELMLSLLGARAVLAWQRAFIDVGIDPAHVTIVPTPTGATRLEHMGGNTLAALAARARDVEVVLYDLTATFIPPSEAELLGKLGSSFYPLLAIEAFELPAGRRVAPLLMIDDAHWADRAQHVALLQHLTLREVTMVRWILQRMEALEVSDSLYGTEGLLSSGIQRGRDVVDVRLTQGGEDYRRAVRRHFRKAAAEIAARYMRHIPDLARHGITSLGGLDVRAVASDKQIEQIQAQSRKAAEELKIPPSQLENISQRVYEYVSKQQEELESASIAPAMVSILLHRQFNRARQRSLFEAIPDDSLTEDVVVEADIDVAAGAKVHNWHRFGVPFLGGLDVLADLGSVNVETFLQLAWQLVRDIETQVIVRGGDSARTLSVEQQHAALSKEGKRIMQQWSFPHALAVRRLVTEIANLCLARSLENNAPLGGGANAVGIEESAFKKFAEKPHIANALRFGVGYNAFSLIHGRKTKGKIWTLLELSGPVIASHGLTTRRGGFVPVKLEELTRMIEGNS
jgi:hypothetical protein